MPQSVCIERYKLNQAMYQKLKKYIMNKRKREAEERAQDDYYKRLKKERDERKRQRQLAAESIENTKREIIVTCQKMEALKAKRNELFNRFKQLAHQEKLLREKSKKETVLLVSNLPQSFRGAQSPIDAKPEFSQNLQKSVGYANKPDQYRGGTTMTAQLAMPTSTSVQASPTLSLSDQRALAALAALYPQFGAKSLFGVEPNLQDCSPSVTASSNNHQSVSLLNQQHLTKCLLLCSQNSAGGDIHVQRPEVSIFNCLLEGAKLQTLNPPCSTNLAMPTYSMPAGVTSISQISANDPRPSLNVSTGSILTNLLPPAPTSYRGSITTGQSAQQIHMQQLAQAQVLSGIHRPKYSPNCVVDDIKKSSNTSIDEKISK